MLLPTRAVYRPQEEVEVELRGLPGGELVVFRLGDEVRRVAASAGPIVSLGQLPEGGYGVEWHGAGPLVRTAIDVHADARARLRYGFTVDFAPGRAPEGLAETVRRLHLTGVQFYDWAYRHADLLGGGEEYRDALGQPVSLDTVRRLAAAVRAAGSRALGYAAVYAVGPEEWSRWSHDALVRADGTPYGLGDFLFLVDPASPDWLAHFGAELRAALDAVGFDGFHLDQYGYPKIAVTQDGSVIDVAESFAAVIESVRSALPRAHLVFNNVNDFPTRRTAALPQDAVYIEPWEPQSTLGSLASLVSTARAAGGGRPVVLAAYQHVYDIAETEAADRATALTMATLFSHGATQLLAGEADRILVDPYYVRNRVAADSTAALLTRWYDFLVEHDELLMPAEVADVTASFAGAYNDDLDVRFEGVEVSSCSRPGAVWRRITRVGDRLVMHLINLVGQTDELWDAPRAPFSAIGSGALRVRAVGDRLPRVRVADPDRGARLVEVAVERRGTHVAATLPEPGVWQLIVVDLVPDGDGS